MPFITKKDVKLAATYGVKNIPKLLPCPFCGCKPKVNCQRAASGLYPVPRMGVEVLVQCESRRCTISPSTGYVRFTAIDHDKVPLTRIKAYIVAARQWNRRKP